AALRAEGGLLLVAEVAIEVVVAQLLGTAACLVACVDLLRRREALVDGTRGLELLDHVTVDIRTLGLAVRSVRATDLDALVPVDLHPGQRVHQLPEALLAVARGVGVLDPEDELAAV